MTDSPPTMPMPSTLYRPMTIIVAATMNNGIGVHGGLPWRLPGEMKYFARVTTGENLALGAQNAVVMGRKTWDGIPDKFRPLKGRRNLVVSRNPEGLQIPEVAGGSTSKHASVAEALCSLPERYARRSEPPLGESVDRSNRIFLIGGSQIYSQCLEAPATAPPLVDRILMTRVLEPGFEECDVFLPDFAAYESGSGGKSWRRTGHREFVDWVGWDVPEGVVEEKGVKYRYEMWVRS